MKNKSLINTENGVLESSISQDKVNNSSLYLDETDSKGVPLLKRIEKYPDLPEDEFIPIEYYKLEHQEIFRSIYVINKKGEVKNNETGYILKQCDDKDKYKMSYLKKNNYKKKLIVHRLVAFTFLENPNPDIYKIVNHIDHNPENNNLSNLEFVTPAENSNKEKGNCLSVSKDKLMNYIAMDDSGNELFKINKINNEGFDVLCVTSSISRGSKYKGYRWKRERPSRKEESLKLIGYSGNLNDYEWNEHWKYPGLFVCEEGYVKYNNKILCTIAKDGYVYVNPGKGHGQKFRVNRLIMEHLLGRDLKDDEIVDHINTIKYDNSFSNLRVTDSKGNMLNETTYEKLAKKLILSDLYGDFIGCYFAKEIYDLIGKKDIERSRSDALLAANIVTKKYICIELGDKETLYKKMENVIYKFSEDKKELLGSYPSYIYASKDTNITNATINKYTKLEKLAPDGNYYMRGPEAVKLVLSLGHGTAGDYSPE